MALDTKSKSSQQPIRDDLPDRWMVVRKGRLGLWRGALIFTNQAMDDTFVALTKLRRRAMKILGIAICFAIILEAFFHTGPHLYLDINSAIFVLGFWS